MKKLYISVLRNIMIVALLFWCGTLKAQQSDPVVVNGCFGEAQHEAFGSGEMLHYAVKYSAAIFTASVADAIINTTSSNVNSTPCYKVEAVGKTKAFYSMFFKLEDTYTTWIEKNTLRPIRATSDLKEGGYRYKNRFDFDWDKAKVYTSGENLVHNTKQTKEMDLEPCSYDAIALFYNMRQINTDRLVVGEPINLSLVLEDTVRTVTMKFEGREVFRLGGVGRFNTMKFSCLFVTSTDQSFKDGDEFFVWISDDKNRIPIYIESPIRVGKIKVEL
ncbi:MAG: DUF3108 domain-containing protein, partial [Rikenellaceae bacterium]